MYKRKFINNQHYKGDYPKAHVPLKNPLQQPCNSSKYILAASLENIIITKYQEMGYRAIPEQR